MLAAYESQSSLARLARNRRPHYVDVLLSRCIALTRLLAVLLMNAFILACSPGSKVEFSTPPVTAPDQSADSPSLHHTLPAGTAVTIITTQVLDSRLQPPSFRFTARLDRNLMLPDGTLVAPRGSAVTGVLGQNHVGVDGGVESDVAGGTAPVQALDLIAITIDGQLYPLQASFYRLATDNVAGKTARSAGGGALVGGLLAGRRGAGIGATVGAFAGVTSAAANSGSYFRIPIGTRLTFRIDESNEL